MAKSSEERLVDLLDQLVNLSAMQVEPLESVTVRARALKRAGLDNQRIARLLETTPGTVSVATVRLHDRSRSRRRRKT